MPTDRNISELWAATYDADQLSDVAGMETYRPEYHEGGGTGPANEADSSLTLGAVIGSGGLADVFAARQGSLAREVAVKRIRDTHRIQLVRMFTHEARITAGLNHPNILPIHDLVSLDGQPSLVMKRVTGGAWSEHLREAFRTDSVDLRKEIRRLVDVCDAIAFAHSRGVLHLDIKPANVMVGNYGETLVMDWGCAALFDDTEWAHQPALPRTHSNRHPFGTPAMMSPEQALGDGTVFGPHTDVYLLGAVLHYLLSHESLRRGDSVLDTVESAAAGVRGPLPEAGPSELNALCLQATEPDPANRIPTVDIFREKLTHWLETSESRTLTDRALARLEALEALTTLTPEQRQEGVRLLGVLEQAGTAGAGLEDAIVGERRTRILLARAALATGEAGLARTLVSPLPEDNEDRTRLLNEAERLQQAQARSVSQARWFRRGLAVAMALLLGAFVGVSWLFQQSERERERTEAVKQFSQNMLSSVDPAIAQGLDNQLMMKVLEKATEDAEVTYAKDPELFADVLSTVARSYMNLALASEAEPVQLQVIELYEEALGPDAQKTLAARDSYGEALHSQGKLDEAAQIYRDVLAARERTLGPDHADTCVSLNNLGTALLEQGKFEESEPLLVRAYETRERTLGKLHPHTVLSQVNLVTHLRMQGRYADAVDWMRRASDANIEALGPRHPDSLSTQKVLADVLLLSGERDEAAAIVEHVLTIQREILDPEHPSMLLTMTLQGQLLERDGQLEQAAEVFRSIGIAGERTWGPEHTDTIKSKGHLARVLERQGLLQEAEELHLQVLAARRRVWDEQHPDVLTSRNNLALVLSRQGRNEEAAELLADVLAIRTQVLGPTHPQTLTTANNLAIERFRLGDVPGAMTTFAQVLEAREKVLGPDHPQTITVMQSIRFVHKRQKQWADAESITRRILQRVEAKNGADHPDTLYEKATLAEMLHKQQRCSEAEPLFQTALAGYRALDASSSKTFHAAVGGARCLDELGRGAEAKALRQSVLEEARVALDGREPTENELGWMKILEEASKGKAP